VLDARAQFPAKLAFLFQPAPYKVAYGGRGAAKSWGFARALLILGMRKKLRVLCAREIQNSIADSVHRLLVDQISLLGIENAYDVNESSILGRIGTELLFKGLQGNRNNVRSVKSTEGLDVIWIEEGDAITKHSWDVIIPTLRKPDAELWVTFNPVLASDETYRRMVLNPPPGAIVVQINWRDNPWFSERQEADRLHMKATDPDGYLNVWEGKCRAAMEGAIFAKELREATEAGRICKVPYDPRTQVHTFWDLGWHDLTAIWMVQKVGFEYHLIDYIEGPQMDAPEWIKELDKRGYTYGWHHLPHDGAQALQSAKGISIARQIRDLKRRVKIMPNLKHVVQISYARQLFPLCYFDEAKTEQGLERLRRYRYDVNADTKERDRTPKHDVNSHGASAFCGFAVSVKHLDRKPKPDEMAEAEALRREELAHSDFGPFVPAEGLGQGWMR
jgi:phage terminase large subunit